MSQVSIKKALDTDFPCWDRRFEFHQCFHAASWDTRLVQVFPQRFSVGTDEGRNSKTHTNIIERTFCCIYNCMLFLLDYAC